METVKKTQDSRDGRGRDTRKRQFQGGRGPKRQRNRKDKPVTEGSNDEVLLADIRALFAAQKLTNTPESTTLKGEPTTTNGAVTQERQFVSGENKITTASNGAAELPEPFTEIDVKVVEISSTGDGLALHASSDQIYAVPFSAPGDIVKAKVIRHFEDEHYSVADFVSVVEPGPLRDVNFRCWTTRRN
jgi:tRNA (uracil-5-)-methyltransferase